MAVGLRYIPQGLTLYGTTTEKSTFDCFVQMSSSESTDSPQVHLVRSAMEATRKRDAGYLAEHMHRDLRRIIYPRYLGKPEQNREEWFQHATEVMSICTEVEESRTGCDLGLPRPS